MSERHDTNMVLTAIPKVVLLPMTLALLAGVTVFYIVFCRDKCFGAAGI